MWEKKHDRGIGNRKGTARVQDKILELQDLCTREREPGRKKKE